jgi:sugar O-acyltransferase (sialic acid O-acetyltransferase NeuD family)
MKKALVGAGGHAMEVKAHLGAGLPCFVDDCFYRESHGLRKLSSFDPLEFELMVAIGDSTKRKEIVERLPPNTRFFSFIHPSALLLDSSIALGSVGVYIGANCIVSTNVVVGGHCLINRGSQIGHDCVLGDFGSLMPGAILSGNVKIGKCFFLGSGGVVREKVTICDDVIVGLNSGVIQDIVVPGVYVGTPAKMLRDHQ